MRGGGESFRVSSVSIMNVLMCLNLKRIDDKNIKKLNYIYQAIIIGI